jgi:cytochrome c553
VTTPTINIILFTVFALGLSIWGMQHNGREQASVSACYGSCYTEWEESNGGVVAIAQAQAAAKAEASPAELGEGAYLGCVACHGPNGGGGVGPQLAGQSADVILGKLQRYGKGETLGPQSALMWSQAAQLSDNDMNNISAYIATF